MSVETITKFSEIISPINKINEVITNHNDLDIEVENLDPWPPVGFVIHHAILLPGFVKANGAEVNREDYPRLVTFATENNLWTETPTEEPFKYGVGNGSTTMILPDYRNRFIMGGDSTSTIAPGLPNIKGRLYQETAGGAVFRRNQEGIFVDDKSSYTTYAAQSASGYSTMYNVFLDASKGNNIYGKSDKVLPESFALIPQIKY